jgi:very-short-patch-repair endonuclease
VAAGRGEGAGEQRPRLRIGPDLRRRMTEVARTFRKEPTPAEALLWRALRNCRLGGRKFRRQHPIGPFVVDFYCAQEGLVVEVDGPIHTAHLAADRERQELLEAAGLRVTRLPTEDVEADLVGALEKIRDVLHPSPQSPLPPAGEG